MIKRLKMKFIVTYMIVVIILVSAAIYGVYYSTVDQQALLSMDVLQKAAEGNALQVQRSGYYSDDDEEDDDDDDKYENERKIEADFVTYSVFAIVTDKDGTVIEVIDTYADPPETMSPQTLVFDVLADGKTSGITGEDNSLRYYISPEEDRTVIAFADRSEEIELLRHLLTHYLWIGAASLLGFFVISVFFASWAVRPIERSWKQQKRFIADASHELRTPLTSILANTDIVLAHPNDKIEKQSKWIGHIKTEAERMTSLVNNLLYLAKSDDAQSDEVFKPIDLSSAVTSSLLSCESLIYEKEKTLVSEIAPEISVEADENKIKQLVIILIDNAVKYSDPHTKITLRLQKRGDKAVLSVNNIGDAIDEEHLKHIFERFYRADESRARESEGYGLGLSIAQHIAQIHKAKIDVASSKENGTTFSVTFNTIKKK